MILSISMLNARRLHTGLVLWLYKLKTNPHRREGKGGNDMGWDGIVNV